MTSRYSSGRRIARTSIALSWAMLVLYVLMTALVALAGLMGREYEMIISLMPAVLLLLPPVLLGCLTATLLGHGALALFDIADHQGA